MAMGVGWPGRPLAKRSWERRSCSGVDALGDFRVELLVGLCSSLGAAVDQVVEVIQAPRTSWLSDHLWVERVGQLQHLGVVERLLRITRLSDRPVA